MSPEIRRAVEAYRAALLTEQATWERYVAACKLRDEALCDRIDHERIGTSQRARDTGRALDRVLRASGSVATPAIPEGSQGPSPTLVAHALRKEHPG